jgi:ribonuclease Z
MRVSFAWIGAGLLGLASLTALAEPNPAAVNPLAERDVYYPGTEALEPDEMRVTACGTGMPNARPKQAAACFLVELGNGDKFLFDVGSGSAERISALKIPYDLLDKVFIGHLHSDHFGSIGDLWIGGVIGNRINPLRVWGPSGPEPHLGTAAAMEHLEKMYAWDSASRLGNVDIRGQKLVVTEFDYRKVNEVIYNDNGVTIRSIPAVHALDGSVSFILDWNGLRFAYSSDTFPNKWWIENTKNADLAVHECFVTPEVLVEKQKFPVATALNVGTQVHTSPWQFGKVMSMIEPRMAVGYHFFNDFDTAPKVIDYMVWNVTKDDIRVRMAAIDEDIWPQPALQQQLPPDPSIRYGFSEFINGGRVPLEDVVKMIYDKTNEKFGTDFPPPK